MYITSCSIRKTKGIQSRVLFDFHQNGMQNSRVSNLMMSADSGTPAQVGQIRVFDNVIFPVTISVRYDTYNKLGTQSLNCNFEVTIYEEGDWEVILKN